MTNIQKKSASHILCGMIHPVKFIRCISIYLKVRDKTTDQIEQFTYITVLFSCHQYLHDFFIRTRLQFKSLFFQFFTQMVNQRFSVIVCWKSINQFRTMLSVETNFIIDCFLIMFQLIMTVPIILSTFWYTKMLDIRLPLSLINNKIWCIRLMRIWNMIWIDRFIFIIDMI